MIVVAGNPLRPPVPVVWSHIPDVGRGILTWIPGDLSVVPAWCCIDGASLRVVEHSAAGRPIALECSMRHRWRSVVDDLERLQQGVGR